MAQANLIQVNGTVDANNGSTTGAIIAAQGAGKVLRVTRGVIGVTTAAAGTGGLVRLCDGTTTICQWDANAVGNIAFDFGDLGYPLTANTALNLIVSGAVTTQATATCAAVANVA